MAYPPRASESVSHRRFDTVPRAGNRSRHEVPLPRTSALEGLKTRPIRSSSGRPGDKGCSCRRMTYWDEDLDRLFLRMLRRRNSSKAAFCRANRTNIVACPRGNRYFVSTFHAVVCQSHTGTSILIPGGFNNRG